MTREELFFTHIEDIGQQDVPFQEEFAKGGAVRKSPEESATSVQEGTVAYGSDDTFYVAKKDKNGVQRWQKIAGTTGFLNKLKVFDYAQEITGSKGSYDGYAIQKFSVPDSAQVPLVYGVYRTNVWDTRFVLLRAPLNKELPVNTSMFWDSNITKFDDDIFDYAQTKLATAAAKVLTRNIIEDLQNISLLYNIINVELIACCDDKPLSVPISQTQTQTSSTVSSAPLTKFNVGDFVQDKADNVYKVKEIHGSVLRVIDGDGRKQALSTFAIDDVRLLKNQPKFKVGDKISFPSKQHKGLIGSSLKNIIDFAKSKNQDFLYIVDVVYSLYGDPEFSYWVNGVINDKPNSVSLSEDEITLKTTPLTKFKVGEIVQIEYIGKMYSTYYKKFEELNFDNPKEVKKFGKKGDLGQVFAISEDTRDRTVYGVKLISGADTDKQILIAEEGLITPSLKTETPKTESEDIKILGELEVYTGFKESTWFDAQVQTKSLGQGWRLPSIAEFETTLQPLFETSYTSSGYWTNEEVDESVAKIYIYEPNKPAITGGTTKYVKKAILPVRDLSFLGGSVESSKRPFVDISKALKFESKSVDEAKMFFEWATKKGAIWGANLPTDDDYENRFFSITNKDILILLTESLFESDEGALVTIEQIQGELQMMKPTQEVAAPISEPKREKESKVKDFSIEEDFTTLPEKTLKQLEKEYDDLMFLISVTPPIDVVTVSKLKQDAKGLKDNINTMLMVEKDKMLAENNIFDELFTASSIEPKHRYNLKPYIDGFAPDGTPTKLPPKVYDLVSTDDFENWFGNFQMAYQFRNTKFKEVPCSIVKNIHYEPQIVFHGTGSEFSFFNFEKFPAMYFAENYYYAEWFAAQKGAKEGHEGFVYPFLLNIRNPLDLTLFEINQVSPQEFMDYVYLQCGLKEEDLKMNPALLMAKDRKFEAWVYLRNSPEMLKVFRDTKLFDGIVYFEQNPPLDPLANNYKTKGFIIFEPNNAKLADHERHDLLLGNMRSFYLKKGGKL